MARWSSADLPHSAGTILSCTLATALSTPRPRKRSGSPSRSSTASFAPVDAPEGTSALPQEPSLRPMLTSTVGLPRESSTSRARMSDIMVIGWVCILDELGRCLSLIRNHDTAFSGSARVHEKIALVQFSRSEWRGVRSEDLPRTAFEE